MISQILDIIMYVIVFYGVSMLVHVMLMFLNVWEKIALPIKLPKSKKYKNKVDPIYELREGDWDEGMYIYKWSLQYKFSDNLWLLIIPYPIKIKTYGYYVENYLYICEKNKIPELGDDLKTIYETKMEKINEEEKIIKEKRDKIQNKFESLNKIFNENYE